MLHIRIHRIAFGLLEHVAKIDGLSKRRYRPSARSSSHMSVHHLCGSFSAYQSTAPTLQMAIHHANMMTDRGHRTRHIRFQIMQYGIRLFVAHHVIAQRLGGILALKLIGQLLNVIPYKPLEFALYGGTVRVAIDLSRKPTYIELSGA